MTFIEILEYMQTRGSSVVISWGEDDDLWECSWITGGERYTAFSRSSEQAVRDAWHKAVATVGRLTGGG